MTLYEIAFKLQHDCPYNDLSRKLPEITFAHWCNRERDVIEISCEDEDLAAFEELQKDLRSLERSLSVKIMGKSFGIRSAQLVTGSCHCNEIRKSVSPAIERHNCLRMEPLLYKHGWEWYRIIVFKQRDIKELFEELEGFTNFQIISRRTIEETTSKSHSFFRRGVYWGSSRKSNHTL